MRQICGIEIGAGRRNRLRHAEHVRGVGRGIAARAVSQKAAPAPDRRFWLVAGGRHRRRERCRRLDLPQMRGAEAGRERGSHHHRRRSWGRARAPASDGSGPMPTSRLFSVNSSSNMRDKWGGCGVNALNDRASR
jgi:hypothetical protein